MLFVHGAFVGFCTRNGLRKEASKEKVQWYLMKYFSGDSYWQSEPNAVIVCTLIGGGGDYLIWRSWGLGKSRSVHLTTLEMNQFADGVMDRRELV